MERWWHYLTPGPAQLATGLACLGVGMQQGRLPTVGPRTLDHWVAVVVTGGRGWYTDQSGVRQPVTAPAVLWLRPGLPHHYAPDEGGWAESFVDFTGSATAGYAELGLLPEADLTPLTGAEAAQRVVARIAGACRRGGPLVGVEAGAGVHELLVELRRHRADLDLAGEPVLEVLRRDACLPLSVAQHARRAGLTVAELRRAVRAVGAVGPKEYLLSVRLNEAKELLAAGELPVAAVARRVGYEDPAYFTRIFTRRVGLAPSAFRAQQYRGDGQLRAVRREELAEELTELYGPERGSTEARRATG
ncbi:helix-turn-helix domain-containing protein [Kitasatospora atroaurantiaca]|uniref:AraC-like DNA-binding protein n=1 Tax=Kitasatospora atroaurantiaca TaxID=285545 RepID=A0A561ETU3_9ACTN|nr:helix-turn-helix domain-containing protein [Kitasatospora atroaurantiaca]TWE19034.1 AraC-like DNA-binding protein [Kitasatospora atroaurantiaca]